LTPSDFWLFAVVKKHPRVIHFTSDEEVDGAIGKWFLEQPEELYSEKSEKIVISASSNESNEKDTAWKHQLWKQSTHSEIYLCFVSCR
jgi:acetylornithine deacetylase/succinyl-diaminopimelate desuccinylase-like protein